MDFFSQSRHQVAFCWFEKEPGANLIKVTLRNFSGMLSYRVCYTQKKLFLMPLIVYLITEKVKYVSFKYLSFKVVTPCEESLKTKKECCMTSFTFFQFFFHYHSHLTKNMFGRKLRIENEEITSNGKEKKTPIILF